MRKPGLSPEHFEQQFPHQEKYYEIGDPVKPWWELVPEDGGERGAYATGGHVVHNAMKIAQKARRGH